MQKNKLYRIAIVLIIISFSISTVISIKNINTVISRDNEEMADLLAQNIYNDINVRLQQHINVGRTIANNEDLLRLLEQEDSYSQEEMEQILMVDLGRIGTQMAENMQLSSYGSLANIYDGMYLVNIGQDSIKEIKRVFEDNVHIFDEKN